MLLSQLNTNDAFEFYRTFIEWYCTQKPNCCYLEIGCHTGWFTARIAKVAKLAVGVDIQNHWETWFKLQDMNIAENIAKQLPSTIFFTDQSSDDYFRMTVQKFDCIFIDGSHEYHQVKSDIANALDCLAEEGIIVVHDTHPPDVQHLSPELCGDAYKAIDIVKKWQGLQVFTFPVRYGLTLISNKPEFKW